MEALGRAVLARSTDVGFDAHAHDAPNQTQWPAPPEPGPGFAVPGAPLAPPRLITPEEAEAAAAKMAISHTDAQQFDDFTVYDAGDTFGSTPLKAVLRQLEPIDHSQRPANMRPRVANFVSHIYAAGCRPADERVRCDEEVEIQVWPACERNLSVYGLDFSPTLMTIRGAAAASFGEGRLEVYTGDATIVIFAESDERALLAAESLRVVNAKARGVPEIKTGEALQAPEPGALQRKLSCASRVEVPTDPKTDVTGG
ncbi:MAG: hypothetical protein OXG37_16110 [Actinomycetia bacterium]|nr:hypothetical protein [Actinomycetes bacterium]